MLQPQYSKYHVRSVPGVIFWPIKEEDIPPWRDAIATTCFSKSKTTLNTLLTIIIIVIVPNKVRISTYIVMNMIQVK